MNVAKITKLEEDGDYFVATLALPPGLDIEDFDLDQLGGMVINTYSNIVMGNDFVLKVGDSITNEKGGDPIIGEVRKEAIRKKLGADNSGDYIAEFVNKHHGEDK